MTRFFLILLLPLILASCRRNLSNSDVVVQSRLYSPDSSYVALTYYVDHGAMGETPSMTTILKVTDTTGSIDKNLLPCLDLPFRSCYFPDHWLDNKTLQVFLEERPFVRAGVPFDSTAIQVNGINCKVVPYDYVHLKAPSIEYFSFSADRKKLLVAYRYRGDLNISAINYGDELPKFGNIFTINGGEFNPIIYASWNGNDIDLFMNNVELFKPSDYLNKKIAYSVNFVDSRNLKVRPGNDELTANLRLYKDAQTDSLLRSRGITEKAIIIESQWRKPENRSQFYYEYEYKVAGKRFRSHFRIYKEFKDGADYHEGDSIKIVYDPKQPLIHAITR